jgi:hypothetical protein
MIKPTGQRNPESSVAALEERVRMLEERLTAVADALRVLAHGLEDMPIAAPGGRPAADAARRAYELLLIGQPHTPGAQVAASPDA